MKPRKLSKNLFFFADEEQKLNAFIEEKRGKRSRRLYAKYVYILHSIIQEYTYNKDNYDEDGKRLNFNTLRQLFGGPSAGTAQIIRDLIQWEYIRLHQNHSQGNSSRAYKLTPAYEGARLTMVRFTPQDSAFIKELVEQNRRAVRKPVLKQIKAVYEQKVTVSEDGLAYLSTKYNDSYLDAFLDAYRKGDKDSLEEMFEEVRLHIRIDPADFVLFSFITEDFYVKQAQACRRVYSNLCNLKREHRTYILLGGKPMMGTDIVNSQIVFSIPLIRSEIEQLKGKGYISKDLQAYQRLATSGLFYEALAEGVGADISTKDLRDVFKEEFYRQVFFSRVSCNYPEIKVAFRKLFPDVFQAIQNIKYRDHERFAIELQDLEASLMVFDVLRILQEEGHVAIPLHDAIYVNNSQSLQRANELIQNCFQAAHGLSICLKGESLQAAPPVTQTAAL